MNKSKLAQRLACRTSTSRAAAMDAVGGVFETNGEALANAEEIRVLDYVTLGTRILPVCTGRNPCTGEQVELAASTAPTFKAGKML